MKKSLYTLAISSFAVHGTASLKVFLQVLGQRLLPVPSKLLNGLTNMSLVSTFDPPLKELLQSSFLLAENRNLELIVYVGYLGNAENAGIIADLIEQYRHLIKYIIVDPVSGDHGRIYVPNSVVNTWPLLIQKADLIFPNLTEIKIFSGFEPNETGNDETFIATFLKQYPNVQLVVTSIRNNSNQIGIQYFGSSSFQYLLPTLPQNFGGTGDLLVAHFILNYFYTNNPFEVALKKAIDKTHQIIHATIDAETNDLLLDI